MTTARISQQERTELRGVIRARAKALKARIAERKADQQAEVERRINDHYVAQRAVYRLADQAAQKIVRQANEALLALYAPIVGDHPEWGGFAGLCTSNPPDLERELMRARATREVEAQAKGAEARLIYWEADALEVLARSRGGRTPSGSTSTRNLSSRARRASAVAAVRSGSFAHRA